MPSKKVNKEKRQEYFKKWRNKNLEKSKQYAQNYYQENCESIKQERKTAYYDRRKKYEQIKSQFSCLKCGENDLDCLEFHHREFKDGDQRVSHLFVKGATTERILEEIKKCDPLCCNCHRKLHWDKNGNRDSQDQERVFDSA